VAEPDPAPEPVAAEPKPPEPGPAAAVFSYDEADPWEREELASEPAPSSAAAPATEVLPPTPADSAETAISLAVSEDPQPTGETANPTLDDMRRTWPAVIELVRGGNAMLAVLLESAKPTEVTERELVLCFPAEAAFYKRKAEQDDYRRAAAEAVRNVTGTSLALRFELSEPHDETSEPEAEVAVTPMSDDELVRKFVEEFGAEEILQDDQEQES
jgi:hypothetical protein